MGFAWKEMCSLVKAHTAAKSQKAFDAHICSSSQTPVQSAFAVFDEMCNASRQGSQEAVYDLVDRPCPPHRRESPSG